MDASTRCFCIYVDYVDRADAIIKKVATLMMATVSDMQN